MEKLVSFLCPECNSYKERIFKYELPLSVLSYKCVPYMDEANAKRWSHIDLSIRYNTPVITQDFRALIKVDAV